MQCSSLTALIEKIIFVVVSIIFTTALCYLSSAEAQPYDYSGSYGSYGWVPPAEPVWVIEPEPPSNAEATPTPTPVAEPSPTPAPPTGVFLFNESQGDRFTPSQWGTPFVPAENWSFLKGDFNGDGKLDVAGYDVSDPSWRVFLNNGTSFKTERWSPALSPATGWEHFVGDFNGDGADDIASYQSSDASWWVSLSGKDHFTVSRWTTMAYTGGWSHFIGDFDGDGRADIASYSSVEGSFWVNRSTGAAFTSTRWLDPTTTGNQIPPTLGVTHYVGDFNGDGLTDIATYRSNDSSWLVSRSTSTQFSISRWGGLVAAGSALKHFVGDFNGDGIADIATFKVADASWWMNSSDGIKLTTGRWSVPFAPVTGWSIYSGDFTGDGISDIAAYQAADQSWYVIQATGPETQMGKWTGSGSFNPGPTPLMGDFNGDGLDDMLAFRATASVSSEINENDGTVNSGGVTITEIAGAVTAAATTCGQTHSLNSPLPAGFNEPAVVGQHIKITATLAAGPGGPDTGAYIKVNGETRNLSGSSSTTFDFTATSTSISINYQMNVGWDGNDFMYVQVCKDSPPVNIIALPPVMNADGSARFGYRVVNDASPEVRRMNVPIGLRYGNKSGSTYVVGPIIASCSITDWTQNVDHFCPPASAAQLAQHIDGDYLLITHANPDKTVIETTRSDNVATLSLSNLRANAAEINTNGNISFKYENTRGDATQIPVRLTAYYASGKTRDTIVGGPILDLTIPAGMKSKATAVRPYTSLRPVGNDTPYILTVVDDTGLLPEDSESDNVSYTAIPELAVKKFEWANNGDGRVVLSVTRAAPTGTDLDLAIFGGTESGGINTAGGGDRIIRLPALVVGKDLSIRIKASEMKRAFSLAPRGSDTLYARVNDRRRIPDLDSSNDTRALLGAYHPTVSRPTDTRLTASMWTGSDPSDVWTMKVKMSDDDGLTVSDVKFDNRYMARLMSLPYVKINTKSFEFPNGLEQRAELKPDGDETSLRSRLIRYTARKTNEIPDGIFDTWSFKADYLIDRIRPDSQDYIIVSQEFRFHRADFTPEVSPNGPGDYFDPALASARFYPLVSYEYHSDGRNFLNEARFPQRWDFQLHNIRKSTVGLFEDNEDVIPFPPTHPVHGNPTMIETEVEALDYGLPGHADNFHMSDLPEIEEPFLGTACARCVHMHWRWGTASNFPAGHGGEPIINPGSIQSLYVGVTRHRKGDEDPKGWRSLLTGENVFQKDTVFWYEGVGYQQHDQFAIHGGFMKKVDLFPRTYDSQEDVETPERITKKMLVPRAATVGLPTLVDDDDYDPDTFGMRILADPHNATSRNGSELSYSDRGSYRDDQVAYQLFDADGTFRHYVVDTTIVPDAPTNLRAEVEDQGKVRLHWRDNSDNEDHFIAQISDDGEHWRFSENVPPNPVNGCLIENLDKNQTYYFRVFAATKDDDKSPPSNVDSIRPALPAPAAPTDLQASVEDQGKVRLRWRDNSDNEDHFVVQISTDGTHWSFSEDVPANHVDGALIENLDKNQTYYFRVFSATKYDDKSAPSNVDSIRPILPAPAGPTNLRVVDSDTSSVRLKWQDNSSNEDHFVVEVSRNNSSWSDSENVPADPVNGALIEHLELNTSYWFRVRSATRWDNRSEPSNVIEVRFTINAPTNLRVRTSGSNSIGLLWDDNSNNEHHFLVEISNDGSSWSDKENVPPNPTNGAEITGLQANRTYYFRVRGMTALNERGAPSNVLQASTVFGGPTNLRTTALGARSVQLKWADNSTDEFQFVVQMRRDGGSWADKENVPANPVDGAKIEDLSPNTTYYFRVFAETTSHDRSAPSNELAVTTLKNAPAAPTNLKSSNVGQTSLKLTWKDNSSDENHFVVEYSTNGTSWNDKENVPANPVNGATITGLTRNKTYYFRVKAVGDNGNRSDPSNVETVKTAS